jgi:hypothetical protein
MTTRWKVNYRFPLGLEVENVVESYPKIGVLIGYSGNKLVEVNYELDVDEGLDASQVMALSDTQLEFFWRILEYRYRLPLPQASKCAQQISPDVGNVVNAGFASASSRIPICLRIRMPDPATFPGVYSRLPILIRLANDALHAIDAVDAVRNYYMILEDQYPDCRKISLSPSKEVTELSYVRDFVSHAKITRNKELLQFLEKELGRPVYSFDPDDPQHQALVNRYRQLGCYLVDQEINKLLQEA